MKKIAITGGIGSGKSTVVKLFHEMGIPFVDADHIAREVRKAPAVKAAIQARFGTEDRQELRKILSSDPKAKKDLEKLLHPLIKDASAIAFALIEKNSKAPFLLYEAALIIEAGRAKDFDGLIVVTAPTELKVARVMKRDGTTKEAAEAMIQAQMSDADRVKLATHTIDNSGDLKQLKDRVQKLHSALQN